MSEYSEQIKGDEKMQLNDSKIHDEHDFEAIVESEQFKQLTGAKKKFIVPLTIFFLSVYITLPLLTSYSHILEIPAIGSISWVWVYAIGLFIMTWTLCMLYVRKSASLDQMAKEILCKNKLKGGS